METRNLIKFKVLHKPLSETPRAPLGEFLLS